MTRNIFCEKCGVMKPIHPEDAAMGYHKRRVQITAKKPEVHEIRFLEGESLSSLKETKKEVLPSLMCDGCGVEIPDGTNAVAVTMWRGQDEPDNWEAEYSQPTKTIVAELTELPVE